LRQDCPVCSVALKESILGKALYLSQQLSKAKVRCYFLANEQVRNGNLCSWSGTMEERKLHLKNCPHWKLIDCPLFLKKSCSENCCGKVFQKDFADHLYKSSITNIKKLETMTDVINPSLDGKHFVIKNSDGSTYTGSMLNGMKNGFGTLESINSKCIYSGSWLNDERHGQGIEKNRTKVYNGEWKHNIMDGYCCVNIFRIGVFTGTYIQGERRGFGVMNYHNGARYTGNWTHGLKDGNGLWENPGGTYVLYDGNFVMDEFNGIGKLTFLNGSVYTGEFYFGSIEREVGFFTWCYL
jgi:hypothetical protein